MTYSNWRLSRTCGDKARYTAEHVASAAAVLLSWADGRHMSAYECPFCGWWHLSSQRREAA